MTDIIVAIIVGGLSLVGVILTNASSNKKVERKIETAQAVPIRKLKNSPARCANTIILRGAFPWLRNRLSVSIVGWTSLNTKEVAHGIRCQRYI